MEDIYGAEGIVAPEFIGVEPCLPYLQPFRQAYLCSGRYQIPAFAAAEIMCLHRSLDNCLPIPKSFEAHHLLRAVSSAYRMDAFPVNTAVNPYPGSRPRQIGCCLNGRKGMFHASVIFIAGFRMGGIHMIFSGEYRCLFPEGKAFPSREAVLRITFHSSGYAQYRLISRFRPETILEKQGKASFSPKTGEPAVIVLHPPEGHAGHIGRPFLFVSYQDGENLPVAGRKGFHGRRRRICIMNIQLRHLNLDSKGAVNAE